MALVLNLLCVENLRGRSDRQVKVTFRGNISESKVIQNAKQVAYFGESFEWPIARPPEPDEILELVVVNHNKYLSNKVVGVFQLLLQKVIEVGELHINEALVDQNSRIIDTNITFDINYFSPDGKVDGWMGKHTLDTEGAGMEGESPFPSRSLPAALDMTLSLRPPTGDTASGGSVVVEADGMPGEDTASHTLLMDQMFRDNKMKPAALEQEVHKPRDFQVCVRILEARQLVGLDIDPVIRIDVGDNHRYSSIKQSTNCPYYDEYFVFDFKESLGSVLDRMITITAYHAYGIPGRQVFKAGNIVAGKRMIGVFKCDVGTVFSSHNRLFWHKWAVLTDPKDTSEGPSGYVKCDIAVIGRGDVIRSPKINLGTETDVIANNLLLPAGIPMDRQKALFKILVFRAEYLPRTNLGIMASVKKTLNMKGLALVDAYVKVEFAGHTGRTKTRASHNPEFKEILSFTDHFPPLCNRIKVQLCDSEMVSDPSIATHFIELGQIMDPGGDADGILPTFGPSWINFYGAPRNYKFLKEHEDLNDGQGEGAAFRGRLLLGLQTQLLDDEVHGKVGVTTDKLTGTGGWVDQPRKDFLLFATIFEASMIDIDLKGKPVYFELSIGQYGNALDAEETSGQAKSVAIGDDSDSDSDVGEMSGAATHLLKKKRQEDRALHSCSTTPPQAPVCEDGQHCFMPYDSLKPCLYVHGLFEDARKRLYHSNLLERMSDDLDMALSDVRRMVKLERPDAHRRLRGAAEGLVRACEVYLQAVTSPIMQAHAGGTRTKLDQYRLKATKHRILTLKQYAQTMKDKVTAENVVNKYKAAKAEARKLRYLAKDPQHGLPDVFLWMVCDARRVAYHRLHVKDLLAAHTQQSAGKQCGLRQTVFLKKPGKKGTGQSGWAMQARVDVALWLGESAPNKSNVFLEKLPMGYTPEYGDTPDMPPIALQYEEVHNFRLRAHLFQGRHLIGSDDSGLSDPFTRVLVMRHCQSTQVIQESVNPVWDQSLEFTDISIHGTLQPIVENPPTVVVEVYDYDTVGAPEFIGRVAVAPRVKTADTAYTKPDWPPPLEWYELYRGPRPAGELLASFELLEGDMSDLPPLPASTKPGCFSLVPSIRPVLRKYRIEALMWGLRSLKRVQLLSVTRPRATIECCGAAISSFLIPNMDKNCNFTEPLGHMDVELPELEEFWSPLTIRVVDCRQFGRNVLVGTCTISQLTKYKWMSRDEKRRLAEAAKKKRNRKRGQEASTAPALNSETEQINVEPAQTNEAIATHPVSDSVNINIPETGSIALPALPSIPGFDPDNNSHVSVTMETASHRRGSHASSGRSIPLGSIRNGSIHNGSIRNGSIHNGSTLGVVIEDPDRTTMQLESEKRSVSRMSLSRRSLTSADQRSIGQKSQRKSLAPSSMHHVSLDKLPTGQTTPGQTAPGQTALAHTPPGGLDGNQPSPNSELPAQCKNVPPKHHKKELLAELDWWSKYDVTHHNMTRKEKEEREDKGEESYSSVGSTSSDDDGVVGIDYSSMDHSILHELKDKAKQERLAREAEDEKKKKKKKKKQKKKKSAKERMKEMKGKMNKTFNQDDEEEDEIFDEVPEEEDTSIACDLKYYPHELEQAEEFGGFEQWAQTLVLTKGKSMEDEDDTQARDRGKLKATFCLYPLDSPVDDGVTQLRLKEGLPNNKSFGVKVIVYILKGLALHPMDLNGKADPYLVLECGREKIDDKENKIVNQLNPVFGRKFEFDVVFPMDSILKISVMDYDMLSADDLIGDTAIDLENRFFSNHRARCGLQKQYEEWGYNNWRNPRRPTEILEELCKQHKLPNPSYTCSTVSVGKFSFKGDSKLENEAGVIIQSNEPLALEVLKNFDDVVPGCCLVAEHIETRSLYNADLPGVEQGKLEMWVDMFPKDMPLPSVSVDITPRLPKTYELRVIVWNTADVVLEDTNILTGEASSDIFVKGFLKGVGEDDQKTDIHYRSLTGEGNFNWRFVFPFDYFKAEEKVVFKTQEGPFGTEEVEKKMPAMLTLQVWDADLVSADDFLGSIPIDLNRVPRPAKDSKKCTEKVMNKILEKDGSIPCLNLFKNKNCRGWFPVMADMDDDDEGMKLMGKVEVELQLMEQEDAERTPAGLGREEPEKLPDPNRPDTSFMWFMNPLNTLKYIICKNFKRIIAKFLVIALLALALGLFFYNMPGAMVTKMFSG